MILLKISRKLHGIETILVRRDFGLGRGLPRSASVTSQDLQTKSILD